MDINLPAERNELFAVLGMGLGIAGVTICHGFFPFSIAGIVFSAIAMKALPANNAKYPMAIAGLICGSIGTFFSIVWSIIWLYKENGAGIFGIMWSTI